MKVCLFSLLLGLVFAPNAEAWTTRLDVGDRTRVWASSQTFRQDDFLRLRVFARGREIRAVEESDCVSHLYGMGLAIRADACGRHLVLRIANSRPIPTRLRIHYYRV